MKINKFTAPAVTPTKIIGLNITADTKFVFIQNNNDVDIVIGIDESLALDNGYVIKPGETAPLPVDGNTSPLYSLSSVESPLCIYWQG